MALTYGFFNSVNGDRKYDADDLSAFFKGLITDGIFSSIGDQFLVKASGNAGEDLQVKVSSGRAYLNSKWVENDGDLVVYLDLSTPLLASQSRYHVVYLEVCTDAAVRACRIGTVAGTATISEPEYPSLTDTPTSNYHVLAYVKETYWDSSFESRPPIANEDITNRIGINPGEGEDENSTTPFIVAPVNDQVAIEGLTTQWQAQWENLVVSLMSEIANARAAGSGQANYWQPGNIQMTNVVVNDTDWVEQSTPDYEDFPFRADIANVNLLGTETPEVFFSMEQLNMGVFSSICNIVAGHLYIYASDVPEHEDETVTSITIPNIICIRAMPVSV